LKKGSHIKNKKLKEFLNRLFSPTKKESTESFFFTKGGEQKKWFVLFSVLLPLIMTIIFSVWGTVISVKSYDLSIESSQNREQIDSTKVIIDEIRVQNKLLITQNSLLNDQIKQLADLVILNRTSTDIQGKHFTTVLNDINNSNVPKLSVNLSNTDGVGNADLIYAINYTIRVSNLGGDIYNFSCVPLDSSKIDLSNFPKNGSLPRESYFEFDIVCISSETDKVRFYFEDMYHKKFTQDLSLFIDSEGDTYNFHLGNVKSR
jgi:hypothetical protein